MKAVSRCLLPIGLGMSLVAASAWTAEVPPAKAAKAAVERGNTLIDREDYPAAVKAFSEALRLDPKSAPARNGRGTAYRLLEKFDLALADFNEVLRLEPKNSEAHRGRGGVFDDKKDFAQALTECDEAIRCDPNNSAAYRTRGVVHSDKGEVDKAVADYDRAIRLNPQDAKAFYDRALEESTMGDFDRAIVDYSEAIRITPADYDQLCGRGRVYHKKGEFNKAIADFSTAICLKPKECEAFAARAHAFFSDDDLDHAIRDVGESLRLNPQYGYGYRVRGAAYFNKGELGKAIADLTIAIQIDSKDCEAYCVRGVAYGQHGDLAKARADFDKSASINPKFANIYRLRGAVYLKNEMFDDALADYTHAIQLEPKHFPDYCARGSIYEKKGDSRKAEDDFAQARRLGLAAVLEKRGLAKATASKKAIDSVEHHIHEEVKRLEYPDAVAQELVAMTRDWNLAAMAQKLAAAKDQQRQGKLFQDEFSQAERASAETLCQEIRAVVRPNDDGRELDAVIRGRSACCMGAALVFNVLGRSIGLDVQGLDIPITASGQTTDDCGHLACLIRLTDGRAAIIDVTGNLAGDAVVSKPFRFTETYREKGSCWELKDPRNPLGLHPLVQPLDSGGLVAEIFLCRATDWCQKGDPERARAMTCEAIRRNPKNAWAYEVQAWYHEHSGDHDRAIADYGVAIQHNPLYATAYLSKMSLALPAAAMSTTPKAISTRPSPT